MTRIAIAGTGTMARVHARAFQDIPDLTIVAVYGRDQQHTASFAADLGAVPYTNLDAMLDDETCDVLDCCLATPSHRDAVAAAAARGRHVIIEKPLALDFADAQSMIEMCRLAGVHLLVAHVLRFEPEFSALAEAVANGDIGTPVSATFARQGFYPAGRDAWYADPSKSGGLFVDLMIHDFDWALWRFGPVVTVYAKHVECSGATRFAQGTAVLRHRDGVLTMATGTWGYPGEFTVAVELVGTGGLLRYRSDETQPLVFKQRTIAPPPGEGVALQDVALTSDPYRRELSHFLDVIAGRVSPLLEAGDSLAALRVSLAASASASTGQPIVLEDTPA
jgi:UDP-N-acetylglucosamine 3-dehydrogenase